MQRRVLAISGSDREKFLQGLVTNDVSRARGGIVYAALLTPQGKYLADFFLISQADRILLDAAATQAEDLARRLAMYRLRANVEIADSGLTVSRGVGPAPASALPDPRHTGLGWRLYGDSDMSEPVDWDALRVEHIVPEAPIELTTDSYILEMGFERLHGVDFRKGCYVGQEVTARMKHKTELKKGLVGVALGGPAAPATPILTTDGREAGTLHTVAGQQALAYLRFDRSDGPMTAGGVPVTRR